MIAWVALLACPAWNAGAQDIDHFAPDRLALLRADALADWERYLERSARRAEHDLAFIEAELRASAANRATPAPASRASLLRDHMDAQWFAGEEARRLADILLSYQTPSGGWSKNIDFRKRARRPGESFYSGGSWSYIGTFDNDATTEELRFLGRAFEATGDPRYREAFLRGIGYILDAQFPNGCWPQVYPLQGGYHDAATFNDEAIPNILNLFRSISRGDFAFVPEVLRGRVEASKNEGIECILDAQIVANGRLTVWGQQHDPITLEPAHGRSYEHASLTAGESVDVVEVLMGIRNPSPRVVEAVHEAVAWFRETAIYGFDYEHPHLTRREGAGPIWARFYEIGTNRPIFSNRDGIVRYDWHELDDERRRGYGWYRHSPATLLRAYEGWARTHADVPRHNG
jgi:PelA/Pel-15E family pectate lyase